VKRLLGKRPEGEVGSLGAETRIDVQERHHEKEKTKDVGKALLRRRKRELQQLSS